MKKTVTVNLGGTVFHIDEDAYQLLDKYLANLRIHFRREEGSDEIMNDFEMRIGELFNERIRLGYEVISIEQVEEVIRRMGKPEEIFDEEQREPEAEPSRPRSEMKTEPVKKRLMRDPDNRIIGGVCGEVVEIDDEENTFVLKTGTGDCVSYLKFDKQAIYQTDAKPEPAAEVKKAEVAPAAAEAPAEEKTEEAEEKKDSDKE